MPDQADDELGKIHRLKPLAHHSLLEWLTMRVKAYSTVALSPDITVAALNELKKSIDGIEEQLAQIRREQQAMVIEEDDSQAGPIPPDAADVISRWLDHLAVRDEATVARRNALAAMTPPEQLAALTNIFDEQHAFAAAELTTIEELETLLDPESGTFDPVDDTSVMALGSP
jgi:hypothetical protein